MQPPRQLAHFNKVVINRLFRPLAGTIPPWVLIEHRGRRSGRLYRTVVCAFPHGAEMAFALTYGPRADWVRNVLAAQRCRVMYAGRWRGYASAEVLHGDTGLRLIPRGIRSLLRLGGVHNVLHLRPA
jgi:deazaflavin-dependent oxidoreductase (nitroreductase family)